MDDTHPSMSPRLRLVFLAIAAILLLALAWTGVTGALGQLHDSQSSGQIAQTATQLAYSLFAVLCLVTTFWGRRWAATLLVCWTVSLAVSAGLASVVWGGTSLAIGFLSGAAAFLIAVAIGWLLRVGSRGLING